MLLPQLNQKTSPLIEFRGRDALLDQAKNPEGDRQDGSGISRLRDATGYGIPPEKLLDCAPDCRDSLFESVEKNCAKRALCVLFGLVEFDLEVSLLLQKGVPIAR